MWREQWCCFCTCSSCADREDPGVAERTKVCVVKWALMWVLWCPTRAKVKSQPCPQERYKYFFFFFFLLPMSNFHIASRQIIEQFSHSLFPSYIAASLVRKVLHFLFPWWNKAGPSALLMQAVFLALHYRGFCLVTDI